MLGAYDFEQGGIFIVPHLMTRSLVLFSRPVHVWQNKGYCNLSYCWFPEIHTIYLINASTCTIDFLYFANECFIEHLFSAGYQLFCWSGRWFMHDLNIKYVQFKYCLTVLSYEGCFLSLSLYNIICKLVTRFYAVCYQSVSHSLL